jgi:hypothetical protein
VRPDLTWAYESLAADGVGRKARRALGEIQATQDSEQLHPNMLTDYPDAAIQVTCPMAIS